MVTIGIIAAVLLILLAGIGFRLAETAMTGKRQTLEEARAWQAEHYDLSWYDSLEKKDYTVKGRDGYVLHVQLLKNPEKSARYIIISHGYTDNRFGSLKYASMYLKLGFNVIIYDLRGHGLNEPTFCTYSVREKMDLLSIIEDSRGRYPETAFLGLHGESLGAATSVAVLGEKPPVDFVVADCGFCEIMPVLKGGMKGMHVPAFLADIASVFAKIRYGYSFSEMRPIAALKDNEIPILFIHGAEDRFILPEHSERMKEATRGYAELHLIPGAGHAMSVLQNPEMYRQCVETFLAERFPGR